MPRISLCLEPIFPEIPLTDRVKKAADAGYRAVEFWDPSQVDIRKMAKAAAAAGVSIVCCTLSEPRVYQLDRPAGPVLANIGKSIAIAEDLGVKTLIGLSSDILGRPDCQKNILIENLKRAADLAVKAGVTIALEPLNSLVDHKGCYLDTSAVGFEIAKCVDCPNVKILYDIYHMQIMEGNLIANITGNIEFVAHFHAAGVPGRNEPMDTEVNYRAVLKKIDALGYQGHVGLEYWPTYENDKSIRDCLEYIEG
jgi:hydroxypyruvate isomerase